MASRNAIIRLAWAILPAAVAVGCSGYQIGPQGLYPTNVETVYIPVFESDSYRRHLGEQLTEAVAKQINKETPFRVVGSPDRADRILYGKITSERKDVVALNRYGDPRDLDIRMQVQVAWVDRRGRLMCPEQTFSLAEEIEAVSGSAALTPETGQSVASSQQLAFARIAEQIVGMMETEW